MMAEIDLNKLSTDDLGYTVDDEDDDDPVLLDQDGNPVDTWRERYPYDERMPRSQYEREKRLLQIQLLKLQRWTKGTGARHVILFEGRATRDTAVTLRRLVLSYQRSALATLPPFVPLRKSASALHNTIVSSSADWFLARGSAASCAPRRRARSVRLRVARGESDAENADTANGSDRRRSTLRVPDRPCRTIP